jgi:hypothetical protein
MTVKSFTELAPGYPPENLLDPFEKQKNVSLSLSLGKKEPN